MSSEGKSGSLKNTKEFTWKFLHVASSMTVRSKREPVSYSVSQADKKFLICKTGSKIYNRLYLSNPCSDFLVQVFKECCLSSQRNKRRESHEK
jgi:hypothetical protein